MNMHVPHPPPSGICIRYEEALNPQQHAVVMHPEGPMLVLAGAGTGKTRTVTYRVARLIETGTAPEQILLLTFTNKAALEMMKRVESLIGVQISGLWGGTFHHIGNRILRRHCMRLGYREGFSILDREDSRNLFNLCLSEEKYDKPPMPRSSVLCDIASLAKNTGDRIEEIVALRYPRFYSALEAILRAVRLYEQKKFALNLMDFDDLANMGRLRGLFDAFSEKQEILHLLDRCSEADGVRIFIGEEAGYGALDQCSVVTAPYVVDSNVIGVLGVVGPTRMAYDRVIPIVDITAKLLSSALNSR